MAISPQQNYAHKLEDFVELARHLRIDVRTLVEVISPCLFCRESSVSTAVVCGPHKNHRRKRASAVVYRGHPAWMSVQDQGMISSGDGTTPRQRCYSCNNQCCKLLPNSRCSCRSLCPTGAFSVPLAVDWTLLDRKLIPPV